MFRKQYDITGHHQPAAVPDEISTPQIPDLNGIKVLVADDERDARSAVATALQMSGAIVGTAHCADAALTLASKHDFDVLVTDLSMPGGDGVSLLKALRLRGKKMPAIALSALRGGNVEKEIREAGFALHVDKPIEVSYLAAAVADVVHLDRIKPQTSLLSNVTSKLEKASEKLERLGDPPPLN
jgi:CheY-like chemotaxis protein